MKRLSELDNKAVVKPEPSLMHPPPYPSSFAVSSLSASFKLDEGYSDETLDQSTYGLNTSSDDAMTLPDWLAGHSEADRAELAYSLLRTLRTSTVAAVVDRLAPLLHMDPVANFPPEITFDIFSYLDAKTLLAASATSRAWRSRTLDSRLWCALYAKEGWRVDSEAIRRFEQEYSESAWPQTRKGRPRHLEPDVSEPKLKKRVPKTWLQLRPSLPEDGQAAGESSEYLEADSEGDHHMSDMPNVQTVSCSEHPSSLAARWRDNQADQLSLGSSILIRLQSGAAKVNWQYLYKQRRRLEENWLKARYTNFQLPHPSHPEEAHVECVYAIQFSGRWLVSGSRDRSVRVWDLETRRLRYPPLLGHQKSVLCLQFDPSPSEDLIVTGSGDTSVIFWRFSTGERIHTITEAHDDSVLNLKYDKRYLVTCSKDMLIKVWNRQELWPTDSEYPKVHKRASVSYPSYIIDTSDVSPSALETQMANGQIQKLAPYSLLMALSGHLAAVNSIQITDDEIVSASGDRLIKIWNIHNGICKKTLVGHDKGIACVQFDGRRIISGSNDNTVRIYDHESGAEVGCLKGHDSLVRAVQAEFGDLPGTEEDVRLEAELLDREVHAPRHPVDPVSLSAGSTQQAAHHCYLARSQKGRTTGSKVPPGGGGGKWGRIVSGSYDEYVFIWKRDQEGKWAVSQRLHQAAAVAKASRSGTSRPSSVMQGAHNQAVSAVGHGNLGPGYSQPTSEGQLNTQNSENQPGSSQQTLAQQTRQPGSSPTLPAGHSQMTTNRPLSQAPPHHHHIHRHVNQTFQTVQQLVPRVFKLQFDSRKIICSSQDPRIVAWDFANDDPEIIEACQFFC